MAIIRQNNWVPQQRVDVPMLRTVESAICADFDSLVGLGLAGREPIVLRSFTIPVANTIGQQAPALQLNTASGLIMHWGASQAGTIFSVSDAQAPEPLTGTNTNVTGSFVANVTNYVGLDLTRNPDPSTSDTIQILDVSVDQEVPEVVPLGSTMQYKIIISTQSFSSSTNVLPIAKVVTDVNNNVVSITDCRNMMFRLGSGGDAAYALNTYPWGSRTENNILYTGGGNPFAGEDKSIDNLTSWMDAVMTLIWEARGGEYWYTPSLRDNVKLLYGQPTLVANNNNFYYNAGLLSWSGLAVSYENAISGTYYNVINDNTGGVSISNGQCLYIDVARENNTPNISAHVANLATLGTSVIPGRRFVLAWVYNGYVFTRDRAYESGRDLVIATPSVLGVVELSTASATPLTPKVVSDGGGIIAAIAAQTALNVTAYTGNLAIVGLGNGATLPSITGDRIGSGIIGAGNSSTSSYGLIGFGGGTNGGGIQGNAATGGTGDGGDFTSGGSGSSCYGVVGFGTNSNHGVLGLGGAVSSASGIAGNGGTFTGGASSGSSGTGGNGIVVSAGAGNAGTGTGGNGIYVTAGTGIIPGFAIVAVAAGETYSSPNLNNVAILAQGSQGVYGIGGGGSGGGIAVLGDVNNGVTGTGYTSGYGGNFTGGASGAGVHGLGGGTSEGGNFSNGTGSASGSAKNAIVATNGNIQLSQSSGNYPGANDGFKNTITPNNICKAWAFIQTNSTTTPNLLAGFNISSGSPPSASPTQITVNFQTPMSNGNYAVVGNSGSGAWVSVLSTASADFALEAWTNSGKVMNLSTTSGVSFYVVVFGAQ
jgi:hypothetical protein